MDDARRPTQARWPATSGGGCLPQHGQCAGWFGKPRTSLPWPAKDGSQVKFPIEGQLDADSQSAQKKKKKKKTKKKTKKSAFTGFIPADISHPKGRKAGG